MCTAFNDAEQAVLKVIVAPRAGAWIETRVPWRVGPADRV